MLGATYFIMRVLGYGVVEGNVSATFAAAVGAVFSLITLSFFYTKYRRSLDFNLQKISNSIEITTGELVKELKKKMLNTFDYNLLISLEL